MDVYGRELRIVNGAYKPDNNWGGSTWYNNRKAIWHGCSNGIVMIYSMACCVWISHLWLNGVNGECNRFKTLRYIFNGIVVT